MSGQILATSASRPAQKFPAALAACHMSPYGEMIYGYPAGIIN
jgi:organic hydroperoxide reductase OsmC/OhrA